MKGPTELHHAMWAAPAPGRITPALLAWFELAGRRLPWRVQRDPYAVWISEIMLQQTRVDTVTPYFERWMARFHNVHELAASPLEAVLKAWEGLGYYARARNLHRAAQLIVQRHNGQLPRDARSLLALPGIGPYTAGAILSLAFGQPVPILDANVRRLLCRVFDIETDPEQAATKALLWDKSAAIVSEAPPGRAGDLNEALIELGALVCRPGLPDCAACPLSADCLARARGVEAERPTKRLPRQIPHHDAGAAVIEDSTGQLLIVQRQADGMLGGLWGFPTGIALTGESVTACLERTLYESLALRVAVKDLVARISHAYTHFKITLHAYRCELLAGGGEPQPLGYAQVLWAKPAELGKYPYPVTDQKIISALKLV